MVWATYGLAQKVLLHHLTPTRILRVIYPCCALGLAPLATPADILRVEQAKAPLLGRLLVSHCVLVHCKGGKILTLVPVKEEEFVRVLRKRVQEAAGVA